MKTFHTTSLADQVFEKLENDIIHGIYPKGEILTEMKLAEQLGVSRTPIREALRRLEQERLIQESGKGSVVVGISSDDLLDIMNIREHIEGLSAYYACKNMTEEAKQELQHIIDLQDFYFAKWDPEHLRQADDDFHDAICELSGRMVVRDTLAPLHRKTRRYRRAVMGNKDRAYKSLQEHHEIFEALISGDPEKARDVMENHLRAATKHLQEAE